MTLARPVVFVADNAVPIRNTVSAKLDAKGVQAYFPDAAQDPNSPTKFIGGFKAALITLERPKGKDDPIDEAELLRMYQPTLPLAFLYEHAAEAMLDRARVLGPVFRKTDQLDDAVAWALSQSL